MNEGSNENGKNGAGTENGGWETGDEQRPIEIPVARGLGSPLEQLEVEPWPEPVELGVLLDELVRTIGSFVILPKWGAEALALWVVHTFAFELRDVTTYIGLESPEHRCGKSTLVTVLSELANRTVVASNVSSSALFRVIEEVRPTLLIDEVDTFLGGNEEMRGILNSGYTRKTAYVLRVVNDLGKQRIEGNGFGQGRGEGEERPAAKTRSSGAGGSSLARFSCWCPKVISRIGRLPVTLADRCIVLRMQRKSKQEKCERLRKLKAEPLRRQCARFVRDYAREIATAEPEIPVELNDRAGDICEPLLALAELAGGDWPRLAREAAVNLAAGTEENNPIGALLLDIYVVFLEVKTERLFTRELLGALNGMKERSWAALTRGKELSEMTLSQLLRPYGVRPKAVWVGEVSARGYVREDFEEIFARYVSKWQVEALLEEAKKRGNIGGEAPNPRDVSESDHDGNGVAGSDNLSI